MRGDSTSQPISARRSGREHLGRQMGNPSGNHVVVLAVCVCVSLSGPCFSSVARARASACRVLRWCPQHTHTCPASWARRLHGVRGSSPLRIRVGSLRTALFRHAMRTLHTPKSAMQCGDCKRWNLKLQWSRPSTWATACCHSSMPINGRDGEGRDPKSYSLVEQVRYSPTSCFRLSIVFTFFCGQDVSYRLGEGSLTPSVCGTQPGGRQKGGKA